MEHRFFKDFYRLFEIEITPDQLCRGLAEGWKTPFRDHLDAEELFKTSIIDGHVCDGQHRRIISKTS